MVEKKYFLRKLGLVDYCAHFICFILPFFNTSSLHGQVSFTSDLLRALQLLKGHNRSLSQGNGIFFKLINDTTVKSRDLLNMRICDKF